MAALTSLSRGALAGGKELITKMELLLNPTRV